MEPSVVSRSTESPSLQDALRGATHVAVCAATSSEPIITAAHAEELLGGAARKIQICSVSRPEAFSLDAVMMIAKHEGRAQLRFDYGDSILAPMREAVNRGAVQQAVTWSSSAMSSEACKHDLDEAVIRMIASRSGGAPG